MGKLQAIFGLDTLSVTWQGFLRYTYKMDLEIVAKQAQKGDTEAFGRLYDVLAPKIFRFIKIKVQNTGEAEDMLQDVFIKAWHGLPKISVDQGNISAWVYRIATNLINDHFRRMYRQGTTLELLESVEVASNVSLSEEADANINFDLLADALSRLPVQYKQVLELRFIQDFTLDETAKILNKSNLSVRVLQHRALKKLKETAKPNF